MARAIARVGRMIEHVQDRPAKRAYSSFSLSLLHAARDPYSIASTLDDWQAPVLGRVLPRLSTAFPAIRSELTDFEDRRFLPGDGPARSTRRVARVFAPARARRSSSPTWSALAFRYPRFTLVCVRRKARRQVIFATGKGGGGKRRPRYSAYSYVRC